MADQHPAQTGLTSAQGWFLVLVIFLTYVAAQIDRQMMAVLVQKMKRDLHFSDEQIGILMGFAFSLTYAVSAIFVADRGDRSSRKRVLATGLALWSGLTLLCGLATNFPALIAARLGVGVGESVLAPTALPMVAAAFAPERRAFPIAFCIAGSPVGLIITPILVGWIVNATDAMNFGPYPLIGIVHGWQLAFIVGGLFGGLILILFRFVVEPAKDIQTIEPIRIASAFAHFFEHPKFYLALFFGIPLFAAANYGLIAWMPAYMARTFGLDIRTIGLLNGIAFIPSAVMAPLIAGFLGRHAARSADPRTHLSILLGVMPVGGLLIALPMLMPTVTGCIIAFSGAVTCTTVMITFGMINIQQVVLPPYRSLSTAVLMASLILVGSGLGPMIVGTLATRVVGEQALGNAVLLAVALLVPPALAVSALARFDRAPHPQCLFNTRPM